MIVVIGTDGDFTFHSLLKRCVYRRVPVQPINLRAIIERGDWAIEISSASGNVITIDDEIISLDALNDVFYFRPSLPVATQLTGSCYEKWQNLVTGLSSWMSYHRARVINAPWHRDDNGFKSFHGHLLANSGMRVPESVISSDVSVLKDFCRLGKTIAKSHAGIRANSQLCTEEKLAAYHPSYGPLFLQRFVTGCDLRVHTIRQQAFAVTIKSSYADYRSDPAVGPYKNSFIPASLHKLMMKIAEECDLYLAGWDFKIDSAGQYWCLEVNPMPGYASYESDEQEISDAIIDALQAGLP